MEAEELIGSVSVVVEDEEEEEFEEKEENLEVGWQDLWKVRNGFCRFGGE